MRRVLSYVCAALFILSLWLPLAQMQIQFVKPMRLSNLRRPANPGAPSLAKIRSGEYQKSLALWFLRTHGFWGHLVRIENQVNYEWFRQPSSSYRAALRVASDGSLYQSLYLKDFNREILPNQQHIESRVLGIKRLQDLLAARGVGFLLVLSTNKISINPALVPWHYHAPQRLARPRTYDRMLPLLVNLGVNLLDTQQLLAERSVENPMRYFTPSGSHWNDVGACEVTAALSREASRILAKPLNEIVCERVTLRPTPRNTDFDLVQMANLWSADFFKRPTPYPQSRTVEPPDAYRPRVLFVGTSFVWSILRFAERHKLYAQADFWYYYNRLRRYPGGHQRPLQRQRINWETDMLAKDLVVIEINVAAMENAGFEFLEDAIVALTPQQ